MRSSALWQLAAALGAMGLAACDAPPAEPPGSSPVGPGDPAEVAASQAIEEVLREENPYARAARLAALLPGLGPEGIPGARYVLRHPRFNLARGGLEIELLGQYWATHEPEAATRWAVSEAGSGYRLSAIFATLSTWAAADPEAALVAAEAWEQEKPDVAGLIQMGLVGGWFEHDPAQLAAYLQSHEMGIARQRKLFYYVRLLLRHEGVEDAVRWAESVPDDDEVFKRNAYRLLASALTVFDLDAALRWCEAHCQGRYGRDLPAAIAFRWSRLDGQAGPSLEWLAGLPEDEEGERNFAIHTTFSWWVDEHPDEAMAWMAERWGTRDLEPWAQLLLPSYVAALANDGRAEAVAWAERVEDAVEREKLLVDAARAWRSRDAAAAEAWLGDSSLSEKARAQVRGDMLGQPGSAAAPAEAQAEEAADIEPPEGEFRQHRSDS